MRDLSDEPETWIETLTTGWAPDVKKNDKMSFPHLAICVMVSTHPRALISEASLVLKDPGNRLGRES